MMLCIGSKVGAAFLATCGGPSFDSAQDESWAYTLAQSCYAFAAPSKCASISSSVFPFVSGRNQVAVTK